MKEIDTKDTANTTNMPTSKPNASWKNSITRTLETATAYPCGINIDRAVSNFFKEPPSRFIATEFNRQGLIQDHIRHDDSCCKLLFASCKASVDSASNGSKFTEDIGDLLGFDQVEYIAELADDDCNLEALHKKYREDVKMIREKYDIEEDSPSSAPAPTTES